MASSDDEEWKYASDDEDDEEWEYAPEDEDGEDDEFVPEAPPSSPPVCDDHDAHLSAAKALPRRYAVKAPGPGAGIRAGVEMASAPVCRLAPHDMILVEEVSVAPSGVPRCRISAPVEGWLSCKCVQGGEALAVIALRPPPPAAAAASAPVLGGQLRKIDNLLAFHEDCAADKARGATYCLAKQIVRRANVELVMDELQLLSKDGTHPGTKFAARCKELFGKAFEDKEAWLSKCAANVVGLKKFCKLLEDDMDIKIECGYKEVQKSYGRFLTLLDDFGEKSPVASQYRALDVRVCNYDYKKTGFVEAFASCMAENFGWTRLSKLKEYCKEQQQAAALATLSEQVACTLSALGGWEGNVSGHTKKYWFRDPSGNEYVSLKKAAEAAASLLSESETETESSNKRSRPDDDDDDAPSSKRPRPGGSDLHSVLARLCKVGNIPYEDQMDTARLSLLVRTRLAQNPSDGVAVANKICSLVPPGAAAVAGTLFLSALGV